MAASNPYDNNELLSLIEQGNQQAFTQLFTTYRDKVYEIALTFTHSNEMAEEVVQDVFLGIWTKRASITRIQDFDNYLFIVIRNSIYRMMKLLNQREMRLANFMNQQQDAIAPEPLELLLEKDYHRILSQAVSRLPSQQRQVYQLIKEQGLSREEAALQLNLHEETIKKHLSLAMRSIRAFCLRNIDLILFFVMLTSLS